MAINQRPSEMNPHLTQSQIKRAMEVLGKWRDEEESDGTTEALDALETALQALRQVFPVAVRDTQPRFNRDEFMGRTLRALTGGCMIKEGSISSVLKIADCHWANDATPEQAAAEIVKNDLTRKSPRT